MASTVIVFFFFFFQAEDGIRDYKVTGVQTCALPIWGFGGGVCGFWARDEFWGQIVTDSRLASPFSQAILMDILTCSGLKRRTGLLTIEAGK